MSDYVYHNDQLVPVDPRGEWEDFIDWAAAEYDAAQLSVPSFGPLDIWLFSDPEASFNPIDNISVIGTGQRGLELDFHWWSQSNRNLVLACTDTPHRGEYVDLWELENPSSSSQLSRGDISVTKKTSVEFSESVSATGGRSTSSACRARRERGRQLVCGYIHCKYEGTFSRRYELERHVEATHLRSRSFRCTLQSGILGHCSFACSRADKLTTHIRAEHNSANSAIVSCPAEACVVELDLQSLSLHIQKRHNSAYKKSALLRAVVAAGSTSQSQCPVCRNFIRLQRLTAHILAHACDPTRMGTIDLDWELGRVIEENYGFVYAGSLVITEAKQTAMIHEQSEITDIIVICPVCKLPCQDHASFEAHFDESHLVAPGQQDHFRAWRNYVQTNQVLRNNRTSHLWTSWKLRKDWINVQCPSCDYGQEKISVDRSHTSLEVDHHVQMLGDYQYVQPYRLAILRLYPDFGSHPIWNDLA